MLLAASLGLNNSSDVKSLPSSIVNCTVDLDSLDIDKLRHSVNIFSGIFIAPAAFNFFYQVVTIALRIFAKDLVLSKIRNFAYIVSCDPVMEDVLLKSMITLYSIPFP